METRNTLKTSNKKGYCGKVSAMLLSILLLIWCWNKDWENNETSSNETSITEVTEIQSDCENLEVNEVTIQEPWEYKIYSLHLNSIIPIKKDLTRAAIKVEENEKLKSLLNNEDMKVTTLLPMIIKESRMDNSQISSSWATWYLQLKSWAVRDIVERYKIDDLKLNVNDPVDNLIMWALYRKRNLELIKYALKWTNLSFSEEDYEKLNIISYNAWSKRITDLLKQSKAKTMDEFKRYLNRHLWFSWKTTEEYDSNYHIKFQDPFNWKKSSELNFSWDNKKVAEWVRYLAVIEGLNKYINKKNSIVIFWKVSCTKEKTLFSQIKSLRDKWYFKKNAGINDICKIVLESNWYWEKETPVWVDLLLVKNALEEYLEKTD